MGWINKPFDEYQEELQSLPADQRHLLDGWSPGYCASRLRVTRSAVHAAVRRGALDGYRLTREGKTCAIIITEKSLRDYENSDSRARYTPKIYRTA